MKNFVMYLGIGLFLFVAGAATDRFYLNTPDKSTTTDVTQTKNTSVAASTDITKAVESSEKDQSHITTHREIKKANGDVITEDVVGDFLAEKTAKENIVLRQQIDETTQENLVLHQKIEENTKPKYLLTFIPAYRFGSPLQIESLNYTFMVQKHIIWDCYLGLAVNKDWLGVPLTCGF